MKITLARTLDAGLIRRVMTHPRLWRWIADDFYPAPERFTPACRDSVQYLEALSEEGELFGLCIAHPINATLWEVDHALLPNAWGPAAFAIGRAFESWLWTFTGAQTAVGFTPADNRLALKYGRRQGMLECGRIPRAFQRAGVLHDVVVFSKVRPADFVSAG